MPNHYLVTGGAGFIGSHIVEKLILNGHKVRVFDNLSTGRMENLAPVEKKIDFSKEDIRDRGRLVQAMSGIDMVFHQAALPSVPRSIEEPRACHEVNITGTLNVLLAARQAGVQRVIYAGSSSAYGDTPVLPKKEDMPPSPLSPYALAKLTGEYYCRVFSLVYGLETITLRYFNVFGPRQNPESQYAAVIPKFIQAVLNGEKPAVFGDGGQTRDFTYVGNVADANILAARAEKTSGNVVNVAAHIQISLNQLLNTLENISGRKIHPRYEPPRPGDVRHSFADISRARQLLGYSPAVSFEEGLKLTMRWMQKA
ncbi:MAG: SDR family oxidoreductase [Candidatus Aminicenantes bacterium]